MLLGLMAILWVLCGVRTIGGRLLPTLLRVIALMGVLIGDRNCAN